MENHRDRPVDNGMDQQPSILEDMINKINSLCSHAHNNNEELDTNTERVRDVLRKAIGIAEKYDNPPAPCNVSNAEKEPQHLTFRMRKALDDLSDALDKNYALISSQNRTIQELNQLV